MVRTHLIAQKSTSRQPSGQLAHRDVTPPKLQESQLDSPQLVFQEEPFEIEIMVPGSREAQDAPAEEPKQQQDEDDEDDDDEEYSPLSDTENEKLYHDADGRESYGVEAPVPIGKL
jgi:hypothetical protein